MINPAAIEALRAVVGADNVLTGELDRFCYSYDASYVNLDRANTPDAVVRPLTTGEVAGIMAIADEYAIPVTPRGAASGRTGGSVPLRGGISLALDRMTRIVELDEGNMMVTAEAGVRTFDLYNFCAAKGLFYPPDPASWKFSTIGGNVAENAGGMRAVKYGVTADYVMGLEVVLADGSVLQTGGKARKNVTGYDLTRLFTGSEGTLGIVTKALLRLIALPRKRTSVQVLFPSLEAGCATVHRMLQEGLLPAAAEIMDRLSLEAVSRHQKMELAPEVKACLIIEVDGNDDGELTAQTGRIEALARREGALSVQIAASEAESERLWAVRRGLSSAVASLAPDRVGEDISVPRDAFPEVVRRINAISGKYNLPIAVYGHAGDGNIHPSVLCNLRDPEEALRANQAVTEIFAEALALGGTLSGEHGIGITKRPYLNRALGETVVQTMRAVKQALDPKGILNPGKIWEEEGAQTG